MNLRSAVSAIDKHGILLVYPIDNRKEPGSLWSTFYPKSLMRWEWDETGDNRVGKLWQLREELSRSGRVVYAKWYRGRATFFSRELFTAFLAVLGSSRDPRRGLSRQAREILDLLEADSPLSTKTIKKLADLRGRALESVYQKATKELWSRLLIVGYGELDEGAFPSLLMGSTRHLFEDLWSASTQMSAEEGWDIIRGRISPDSLFLKELLRTEKSLLKTDSSGPQPTVSGRVGRF